MEIRETLAYEGLRRSDHHAFHDDETDLLMTMLQCAWLEERNIRHAPPRRIPGLMLYVRTGRMYSR